jgi:hypothetical protein
MEACESELNRTREKCGWNANAGAGAPTRERACRKRSWNHTFRTARRRDTTIGRAVCACSTRFPMAARRTPPSQHRRSQTNHIVDHRLRLIHELTESIRRHRLHFARRQASEREGGLGMDDLLDLVVQRL